MIGIKVCDHVNQGYLTWTVSEVRSVGTPLTSRILARMTWEVPTAASTGHT